MNRKNFPVFMCVMILFLVIPGLTHAQTPVKNPFSSSTDVYYRINFQDDQAKMKLSDVFDRILEIEFLEPRYREFVEDTGIDLQTDVFPWMGNRVQIGIMNTDGGSVVGKQIDTTLTYIQGSRELKATTREMRKLNELIELYQNENDNKLPDNLKAPEFSHITPPRGGRFTYRKLSKDRYVLTVPSNQFADINLKGELPLYDSKEGFQGTRTDKHSVLHIMQLKNYLVAIDVKDSRKPLELLGKILDEIVGISPEYIKTVKMKEGEFVTTSALSYGVKNNMLLLSDRPEILKSALVVLNGSSNSLESTPLYRDFIRRLRNPDIYSEVMFANLRRFNLKPEKLNIKDKEAARLVKSFSHATYVTRSEQNSCESELVFHMDPSSRNSLPGHFFTGTTPYGESMFEYLPSNVPMVSVVNLGEAFNLFKSAINIQEGKGSSSIALPGGMDFSIVENEILRATSGEVGVSYKTRNAAALMLQGIYSYLRLRQGGPEVTEIKVKSSESPETVVEENNDADVPDAENGSEDADSDSLPIEPPDSKDNETGMTDKEPLPDFTPSRRDSMPVALSAAAKMPMVLFIQIKDRDKVEKLLTHAGKQGEFTTFDHKGTPIYRSDKMAYALTDNLLIVQTYPSINPIKRHIDMLSSGKTLGNVTRYREFRRGIRGRVLWIQYQDIEWFTSITRGFLLLALPEFSDFKAFRQEFTESWSSLSVSPTEIQIRFSTYRPASLGFDTIPESSAGYSEVSE